MMWNCRDDFQGDEYGEEKTIAVLGPRWIIQDEKRIDRIAVGNFRRCKTDT